MQAKDLETTIIRVPGFFSAGECFDMILDAEERGFSEAQVSVDGGQQMMKRTRNNDRVIFDDSALAQRLFERMHEYLPSNEGATAHSLNPRFRFYRYDSAQRFKAHIDGVVNLGELASAYTALIYLNDEFEGGETKFYSDRGDNGKRELLLSLSPSMGELVLFKHEWWHEGAEIISGRKYVLRTDVMYAS